MEVPLIDFPPMEQNDGSIDEFEGVDNYHNECVEDAGNVDHARPAAVPLPKPAAVQPAAGTLPRPVASPLPRPAASPLLMPAAVPLPKPAAGTLPRPVACPLPRPAAAPQKNTLPCPNGKTSCGEFCGERVSKKSIRAHKKSAKCRSNRPAAATVIPKRRSEARQGAGGEEEEIARQRGHTLSVT